MTVYETGWNFQEQILYSDSKNYFLRASAVQVFMSDYEFRGRCIIDKQTMFFGEDRYILLEWSWNHEEVKMEIQQNIFTLYKCTHLDVPVVLFLSAWVYISSWRPLIPDSLLFRTTTTLFRLQMSTHWLCRHLEDLRTSSMMLSSPLSIPKKMSSKTQMSV